MTWRLSDVVDRKSIVIHVGNSKKDTRGCILLGMAQGVLRHKWAITSSMQAMLTLLEIVGPNSLTIDITAAPCG
jgi:hypothetical protein